MSKRHPYAPIVYALRTLRGYSQPQLARIAGVSPRTIRTIESGANSPRANILIAVLDALDANAEQRAAAMGCQA